MGYYTQYSIIKATDSAKDRLKDISGYTWYSYNETEPIKWYNWKDDLATVSKEHPDEEIILAGVGEEHPDIWQAYAKGGVVTVKKARIVFEDV